jgi:hypothetical protein
LLRGAAPLGALHVLVVCGVFGFTRGELALAAFIFVLVYTAGLLPKIVRLLTRSDDG